MHTYSACGGSGLALTSNQNTFLNALLGQTITIQSRLLYKQTSAWHQLGCKTASALDDYSESNSVRAAPNSSIAFFIPHIQQISRAAAAAAALPPHSVPIRK
jgi:hypothetical protein